MRTTFRHLPASPGLSMRYSWAGVLTILFTLPASATDCASVLDRATHQYRQDAPDVAARLLEGVREDCDAWPQLHHDLGVVAAAGERWDAALAHLQRALDADRRVAETARAMRDIHRYRAALALREALGKDATSAGRPLAPALSMQDSSVYIPREAGTDNANASTDSRSPLRDVSTLEYELYDWWQAAASGNQSGWLQHYAADYPPPPSEWRGSLDWQAIRRDISFTTEDAVVVLSGGLENGEPVHVLMLLRLAGNRWQIYRETRL